MPSALKVRPQYCTLTYALHQEVQYCDGGGVDGGILGGQVGPHGIDDGVQHRGQGIPHQRDDVAQHLQCTKVHFTIPVRQSRCKYIKYLKKEGRSGDWSHGNQSTSPFPSLLDMYLNQVCR